MKLERPCALLLPLLLLLPVVVTEAQTCSNGLSGYEASDVCCPAGCGRCGGSGCSKRGDGCCTGAIKDSGIKCSKSRSAPCIIDTDSVDPVAQSTCSNGLPGYEASDVCCPAGCGRCGGSGCSKRGDGCCTGAIKDSGIKCSKSRSAPCIIDTDSVDPVDDSEEPDSGDATTCPGGIPGINSKDVVCCSLSCGSCAGSGCSSRPGGKSACCGGAIISADDYCGDTNKAPCIIGSGPDSTSDSSDSSDALPTCSNGLPGYESSDVCCPTGCGQCGGSGCSKRGDGCCTGDIKDSGIKCSKSRSAPCKVDTDSVDPVVSAGCSTKWDVAGSDVVLLMGQSNMSGSGKGYDAAIDGPNDPRIKQWTRANKITTASEQLEHADTHTFDDTRVGMGTAFGRAYVQNLPPQRDVLLVPTAYRGTKLVDGPWSPGGDLFEDAVTRLEAALASNEGTKGNCVGAILWHQGEKDAELSVDQDAYESSWIDMISELRSRIPAASEAPVILGEFTEKQVEKHPDKYKPILAAIRAIPDAVSTTAVASSDGLKTNSGDDVHFSAAAQREYGRRYFDKLVEAVENA
eukprot:g14044.t1